MTLRLRPRRGRPVKHDELVERIAEGGGTSGAEAWSGAESTLAVPGERLDAAEAADLAG